MDINSLLADPADDMPRRSSSNAFSVTASSPALSAAKLSPPQSAPTIAPTIAPTYTPTAAATSVRKRSKRGDSKPIWAVLEGEALDDEQKEQLERGLARSAPAAQQARPPPSQIPGHLAVRPQQLPGHAAARAQPPPPPPAARVNGAAPPAGSRLSGLERPITDDDVVYNEITRSVCDFIWNSVVTNHALRAAVAEAPGTEVEIEARWGHIVDRGNGFRLTGIHATECVVREEVSANTTFESTMNVAQHKKMNTFLNHQVGLSNAAGGHRAKVEYKHTHEGDTLYELDQEGFNLLHPAVKVLFNTDGKRQRIRVTRDLKTGAILRKLIKFRIGNLAISSPATEWDYRIGINLEVAYPGPTTNLKPIIENGRSVEAMERKKDRMSYSYLDAFQIDLTQVAQGGTKNHELELEVSGRRVVEEAERIERGEVSGFEELVGGMMNNLRVLSREITPPK